MTKEIIKVEILDIIKNGLAGYSEIITSSYGEKNGIIDSSYDNIATLGELHNGDNDSIIKSIRQKLKGGETVILLPHKLEELDNFSNSDIQFIIEILDKGEHIGYIDGKDVEW